MGCITSTNKLHELRQENVFRVRVAHLQPSGPEAPIIRSGFLELTPRELIFLTPGYDPIVWALQHLRRYGLNGDLFSFEAGRRCMSGPGIYTFRIHNAEQLYPMFQRYINAVNTDAFAQGERERERERVNSTHSVSVLMGRGDVQPHSNNYLEPAPLMARANAVQAQQQPNEMGGSVTDSPDSLPNLQLNAADTGTTLQSPITPGAYINTNANLYFDQPLHRLLQDQNNRGTPSDSTPTSNHSAFSTMRRQHQHQQQQQDIPPQESAPGLNESVRLYANVDTPRDRLLFDLPSSERCYENINRLDLPLLPRDSSQHSVASASATSASQQQQQQPLTPTSLSGVNYIVLDLDQPRSPAQSSPKVATNINFGSGLSLTTTAATAVTPDGQHSGDTAMSRSHNANGGGTQATGSTPTADPMATQGYSTIDFIRTYALNKSSTAPPHDSDSICQHHHDHSVHEDCELRSITRHSKCVRKSYSISE